MSAQILDCKELNCPMPIVRISQAIKKMAPGEELVVHATDPAFPADVKAWASRLGHALVSIDEGSPIEARIRKKEA